MVFLEHNLSSLTNDEIKELLKITSEKKKNLKDANELLEKINPIKESIELRKDKCNKIIKEEEHISVESGNILVEESIKIRNLSKEYSVLKTTYDSCLTEERNLKLEEEKVISPEKNKISLKQIFKNSGLTQEEVTSEKIEDKIAEGKKIDSAINKCKLQANYLASLYKSKKISENEFSTKFAELKRIAEIYANRRVTYDKMIEAYYKIQQNIKEIMSYDVDEIEYYKKHHSSNHYKAFIAKICENIRLKNEEILSLKDFLTKGLIKNLSEQYNIKVVERNNIVEESKKQENINLNSNDMVPRLAM